MKITDVVIFSVSGRWENPRFGSGERQVKALDTYSEFNLPARKRRAEGKPQVMRALYVEIRTDEVFSGLFGPIDETQAFVIHKHLRSYLIGRDPLATETLLDQMLRLHRHGRSGLYMTGVSPVDCALWDLKGKAWGQPVYRLLGGPTRETIPAYASMLGFSVEPDVAAEIAREYKLEGFTAQKWFFRYGPGDGVEGVRRNLAMAQAIRDAVGPHYPLMFDAYMGWDARYASKMVQALDTNGIDPTWIEEPVPPERIGTFRRIRAASRTPIATGEHVYTRWQVKELLVNEAVDFIQTDPDWTGGITELVKICALCSAFEVPVVAHGHSLLAALHVAASQSPNTVPYVEFLFRHQANKQFFHAPVYFPDHGSVKLPDLPGLGIVLDEDKVESREEIVFS